MGLAEDVVKSILPLVSECMAVVSQNHLIITEQELGTPYPPSGPAFLGPPAMRTGLLREGLHRTQNVEGGMVVETLISTRSEGYNVPADLEFGHGDIAPRPYMGPMRDRIEKDYLSELASEMRKRLNLPISS